MEVNAKNGQAAASLMSQFMDAGLVRQNELDQSWEVANDGSASKFRPVDNEG